jgi:hypothetical protein
LRLLKNLAHVKQPKSDLLRIYWYDGTSRGPTQDHRALADFDDVKLRLGFINSFGQQKGVDSLIVTDLVELARNGAIGDALLLGGDEDLRIGVQIAQTFGVRVHLIGIEPSRGSQSNQLRQEVDTKHEITKKEVPGFLQLLPTVLAETPIVIPTAGSPGMPEIVVIRSSVSAEDPFSSTVIQGIEGVLHKLSMEEIKFFSAEVRSASSVPSVIDRKVLASCRTALGRDLTIDERSRMRKLFIELLKQRAE